MTPTTQDVSRRLAAHPKWTWMRGMLAVDAGGKRWRIVGHDTVVWQDDMRSSTPLMVSATYLRGCAPDLDDPATQGCLIAMLGDDFDYVALGASGWVVELLSSDLKYEGATLGEVLGEVVLGSWWGEP